MRRVAFKTVGCRLNQAETAQLAAAFAGAGYTVVPYGGPADVVVVHSCAITAEAERDSVRLVRTARRAAPHAVTVLTGCAAEVQPAALRQRSGADLVVGQADKQELPRLVNAHFAAAGLPPPDAPAPPRAAVPHFETVRALVKVQDGCDFRCSYCLVPQARPTPASRPCAEILDEVRRLVDAGYREVTLTGANVGCYRDGPRRLPELAAAVATVPGLARLRVSSVELSTVECELIDLMAEQPVLARYLHLPLQSGDDEVLRAMGRRYTTDRYREVVAYASARIRPLGIGTDIIAGFPGETEAAAANTRRLVEELPFSHLHVFTYSPRQGTPAAARPDQVPMHVRRARTRALRADASLKQAAFAARCVGTPVQLLVERHTAEGWAQGWTGEYLRATLRRTDVPLNSVVTVTPTAALGGELEAD